MIERLTPEREAEIRGGMTSAETDVLLAELDAVRADQRYCPKCGWEASTRPTPDGVADIAWNLEKIHALKTDSAKSKATLAAIRAWAMEAPGRAGDHGAMSYDHLLALLDAAPKETP